MDPNGEPYKLLSDGKVEVTDANKYPYLGEWLYNEQRPY
jgi:hypothetical protein